MAITASHLTFTRQDGTAIPSGSLHAFLGPARVGGGTEYRAVIVTNAHPTLTLSAVKFWLTRTSGAPLALALGNGATNAGVEFAEVADPAALAYSTAATKSAALALTAPGTLAPGQRARLFIRRTLTGASAADPQTARLYVGGTSPL
jgi:hypothetical protein